jgi:hypothetical protein
MSRLIVVGAALVMMSSSAHAQAVKLRGPAADAFVAKYFPNAAVPGRVKGQFTYPSRGGRKGSGLAKCDIPAMGARSDGAVSLCKVIY